MRCLVQPSARAGRSPGGIKIPLSQARPSGGHRSTWYGQLSFTTDRLPSKPTLAMLCSRRSSQLRIGANHKCFWLRLYRQNSRPASTTHGHVCSVGARSRTRFMRKLSQFSGSASKCRDSPFAPRLCRIIAPVQPGIVPFHQQPLNLGIRKMRSFRRYTESASLVSVLSINSTLFLRVHRRPLRCIVSGPITVVVAPGRKELFHPSTSIPVQSIRRFVVHVRQFAIASTST